MQRPKNLNAVIPGREADPESRMPILSNYLPAFDLLQCTSTDTALDSGFRFADPELFV